MRLRLPGHVTLVWHWNVCLVLSQKVCIVYLVTRSIYSRFLSDANFSKESDKAAVNLLNPPINVFWNPNQEPHYCTSYHRKGTGSGDRKHCNEQRQKFSPAEPHGATLRETLTHPTPVSWLSRFCLTRALAFDPGGTIPEIIHCFWKEKAANRTAEVLSRVSHTSN